MNDNQTKLLKWFKRQIYMGYTYDQSIQELLDTRLLDYKEDKELDKIYEIFVYMPDKEWEEVRREVIDN